MPVRPLQTGLDPAVRPIWNRLAAEHFYQSEPWLRVCELYGGVRLEPVLVTDGDRACGSWVTAYDTLRPGNYDWTAKYAALQVAPPSPAALLVAPSLAYSGAILRDDDDPALLARLLAELRDTSLRMTGQPDRVAMYLSTADVIALRRAGVRAHPLLLEPDAWIELPDGGWEGYLYQLATSRRHKVRREVRRFQESGCTITHHALPEVYELLPPLAESMAIKYGYSGRAPGFLLEFGKYVEATGDLGRVAMCWHDGQPTGFCLYYPWGSSIFLRWASFDYARLTGSQEYFNLSYYAQVRIAEERGLTALHAGKNALAAKVLRGATLRPLWALDLSDREPSDTDTDRIRAANAGILAQLRADDILGPAIADLDDWTPFC